MMNRAMMVVCAAVAAVQIGFAEDWSALPRMVCGGERIAGWTVDGRGWWHAKLPAGTKCSHFFVNGQRRTRPTLPRKGWFYMDKAATPEPGRERQRFSARPGQIDPKIDFRGVEACVVHAWNMSRLPVAGYDEATRVFTCATPRNLKAYMPFDEHHWYRLENVREALGEPGDWYLARDGELTYVPMPGEKPETSEAWAGLREHALVINGQTNVVIKGVTFAYTGWNMPEEGQKYPQAGANVPAAVLVTNSKNVRFEDCAFVHTGGYGLEFGAGCEGCSAVRCEFSDLGAGGVKIGSEWKGADDPATWATGCSVEECLVEHGGRFEPAGVGLWIGNANHCRLVRNTIREMYYSGISVGWTWDRKPNAAHHNLIACNDISDIGQRRLMDMGGIYLLGAQPGTEVIGNTIREVTTTRGCGFALYFDQGSSFIHAVSNYVARGESGNFFVQFNTASNVVEDNVFVQGRGFMLRHAAVKAEMTRPTRFERNVIWWDDPCCDFSSPSLADTNFISSADNVYCFAGSDYAPPTRGSYRKDIPMPQPLCAAGRTVPRRLTCGLPPVPAVFDEAPAQELGDRPGCLLTNAHVCVEFDAKGRISSIRETATGRELVGRRIPFVEVTLRDGTKLAPAELRNENNEYLNFVFPDGRGECWLWAGPFDGGWTFKTIRMTVADVEELTLGQVAPSCNREIGGLSNIVMDDASAVVLRGYTPELDMGEKTHESELAPTGRVTLVRVQRKYGFNEKRFGLAAGPADRILGMLERMAEAAGKRQTGCGGPKSLSFEGNRGAYIFGTWMDMGSADDWIRLLDKAGCRMFHLHAWWLHRGSYEVNPFCFPNGMADMKNLVDRLHASGRRVSTHSLSAVVQFGDPHITPEWFDDLATDASYRLARPYRRGDTELWVAEKPASCHARVLNGGTNGNILRLGGDLLQYDDFTTEPPYKFTGVHVAREPYGDAQTFDPTQALGAEFASREGGTGRVRTLSREEYPAGAPVDYLHHRYAEFVAKPGSRLAEELTDRLASVFNDLGLDGIYFDGSEAMNTRYGIDWLRERTIGKLRPRTGTVINSASCRNPFNWWNRSIAGTWDHPTFDPRGFNDRHIRVYRDYCHADFLRTDLGWWNTHAGSAKSRGYFPEEQDYVGCKTTANDYTISLQGPRPSDGPLAFAADLQLTIFGKWERARYARAFRPELLGRMKTPGEDWRFRQDASGEWTVAPLDCPRHRVASPEFASWSVPMRAAGPAALRVEALYSVDRTAKPVRVLDASHVDGLVRSAQEGVTFDVKAGEDPGHGPTIRLTATNASAEPKAAWTGVLREFDEKNPAQFAPVSSLWVKGDGSGATLNVQMRGWSRSENYVKLDFTGWRKVDLFLRERDADLAETFVWPYESPRRLNNPSLFMGSMDGGDIRSVGFFLNGIPRGARVDVEVGAWDAYPQSRGLLTDAVVELNGTKLAVPFALAGGEFAELADGFWTHFAETGEPLERKSASVVATVAKGANEVRYSGRAVDGGFGRAEVTLFGEGTSEPAFVALTDEQKGLMNVEYELPVIFNPGKGLVGPYAVRVRPGERATLGFEILGPVKNPVVAGRKLPVTLESELDRVSSYDGRTWQAIRITPGKCGPDNRTVPAKREVLAEGVFDEPLPVLSSGTTELALGADDSGACHARFSAIKYYGEAAKK